MYAQTNGHQSNQISPNGQSTIPNNGSMITQTINQIVLHLVHRFVHHIFFVHIIGVM